MRSTKRWFRNKFRQIFLICLEFFCGLFIRDPRIVFLVYGDERHKRACWSKRREKRIGLLGIIGLIRFVSNGVALSGLTIATTRSREEIDRNPALALTIIDEVRRRFPKVRAIALAGQFPSWIKRAGKEPPEPCVTGTMGTCFTVVEAVRGVRVSSSEHESAAVVAVVGGGGYTGNKVVELLAKEFAFATVIAVDPRYKECIRSEDRVYYTSAADSVRSANLVVVLTAKGDDALESAEHARHGSVWLDDTHPTMGRSVLDRLVGHMVNVRKITSEGELVMFPGLPDFSAGDIPGCLLEALVVAYSGRQVLSSYASFAQRAVGMGIRPRLGRHPEY